MGKAKTAIVLGAYGLIGSACVRALKSAGFSVTGVGRSLAAGLRCDPRIAWLERDISDTPPSTWRDDLAGAEVVVNASGALQDGARDRLSAIHEAAISNLIAGLAGSRTRFIQISAAGVSEKASTGFLRSKMRGDRMLMESDLDWVILRPTLVIGPQAYGGTALLRASAAVPGVDLRVLPTTPIQTVSVDDVAHAVVQAARGQIPTRTIADLTEPEARPFETVIRMLRAWQGFPARRLAVPVPWVLLRAIGLCADGLGWLGWRSPLRTTALRALADGVTGDPGPWRAAGGRECRGLEETLAGMPATLQERWFARLYLLLPVAVATLAAFWIVSGLIGLANRTEAQALLVDHGVAPGLADLSVIGGAVLDIVLGLAVLFRPWARRACLGMVVLSVAYLIGGSIWTPDLWADPLGPLLKVLPAIMLAVMVGAILEER